MSSITVLGMVAGVMTTVSFLPQLLKVWRSKSASDLSFFMLLILNTGMLLWLIYGFLIQDLAVVITHSVSLVLALLILGFKIKYQRQHKRRMRRQQALQQAVHNESLLHSDLEYGNLIEEVSIKKPLLKRRGWASQSRG